jgi:hypothetical protein
MEIPTETAWKPAVKVSGSSMVSHFFNDPFGAVSNRMHFFAGREYHTVSVVIFALDQTSEDGFERGRPSNGQCVAKIRETVMVTQQVGLAPALPAEAVPEVHPWLSLQLLASEPVPRLPRPDGRFVPKPSS